jgi:hypothetical protein
VAVLRDSAIAAGIGQFAVIQSVAPSIGVDVSVINMRDARQIEQDIMRFANSPNGGLILTGSAPAVVHQKLMVALAAQHKLPAVYYRATLSRAAAKFPTGGLLIISTAGLRATLIASSRARSRPGSRRA